MGVEQIIEVLTKAPIQKEKDGYYSYNPITT